MARGVTFLIMLRMPVFALSIFLYCFWRDSGESQCVVVVTVLVFVSRDEGQERG